jgi:hypothetical protein
MSGNPAKAALLQDRESDAPSGADIGRRSTDARET